MASFASNEPVSWSWHFRSATPAPVVTLVLLSYLLLVRVLRYRNARRIEAIAAPYMSDPHKMPYGVAFQIIDILLQYEFPFSIFSGTKWALLKSYGIAEGTQLLVDTRQLVASSKVGKRAEDTALMIQEMLVAGIDSDRGSRALSRMNWLHRRYADRIRNDDYIHTLSLFVLEPLNWIRKFEWRKPSEVEEVAQFVYWREIGSRMGIKSLPTTLNDLRDWQRAYEKEQMYFAESNKILADAGLELFLREKPRSIHPLAKQVASSLLEPHVRVALGFQNPPRWLEVLIKDTLQFRGLVLRYLAPPRYLPARPLSQTASDGRIYRQVYLFEPWYVPETVWSRVQKAIFGNAMLLPGPEFESKGYLPEELGPTSFKKVGREAVLAEASSLRRQGTDGTPVALGCPFRL